MARCRQVVVDEVRAAQLRHASSSSPAPSSSSFDPNDTRHFAPHILSFLQSAFDSHPTRRLNKTERKELARAAGLSEKQVSTWFGNAKQRERRRREREATGSSGSTLTVQLQPHRRTASARTVPYDIDMAPHHRGEASYERQQQLQQSRSWSSSSFRSSSHLGSSVSSSSSSWSAASGSSIDVVEYAESAADSQFWPAASESSYPPGDLIVDSSSWDLSAFPALDPSGWFSSASSSAAGTREAAPSPASPPLLVLPPELDPNAPTPSSWSSTCASSPSLTFDDPLDPPGAADSFALEYPFPVTVPAPADAWMDEEFYRNLFGSLGLEMDGQAATAGGTTMATMDGGGFEALLGELGGFGGDEGATNRAGGITLSMDELRRDGEEMLML
ncbi:hypothetical protein BMF94_3281 [Rhodotorula taiwanensis]|uniref:Homeobox domain-containing protein n=1 Tax=Rhodotorula taiwanensis TaxID=741276 RepID=A0A2S5BAE1_9BASI|nr:hypothetical protein BMF94_3281 [Rhodotorula taiwanensis]